MRVFIKLFTILFAIIPFAALAQMDIDNVANRSNCNVSFADSIRLSQVSVDYFSKPKYRYERHLIREKRNKLEIINSLAGSMTNLNEPWIETSGGDNSITLLASIMLKHTFTKDKFSLATSFSGKFGYYRVVLDHTLEDGSVEQSPTWYKNQDEVWLSITPSIKMTDHWSYGATVKFRTQFADGYVSSGSQESYHLKSAFLAPGYLDVSGGLIYKSPSTKLPFEISLSPLALSAIYVSNEAVKENAQYKYKDHETNSKTYAEVYGVNPFESSEYEGGSSIQIDFDRYFGKKKSIRYTTSIFSFYGWMSQLTYNNKYTDIGEYEVALEEWTKNKDKVQPMLTIHPTVRWEV